MIAVEALPKQRILAYAKQLGFDLVGVTGAQPFADAERVFKARAGAGMLAAWHYPPQLIERYCRPQEVLPGARSIICTATSYLTEFEPYDPAAPGLRGAVASYAWSVDYHRTIGARMQRLAAFIDEEFPGERAIACVDTGPLVDRAAAVRAGIGWFGKNGNVLTREFGSWVLLGELITTLELPPDEPLAKSCGQCVECIDRCPTGAIGPDGSVDCRLCISDLTQQRGVIPRELRRAIGNRVWGCDDCQTVCPVNERKQLAARGSAKDEFRPLAHIGTSVDLSAVLAMTKSQFRTWFGPTAMAWRGKAVLQRNAAVALGNSRDPAAIPPLIASLDDRKALVRGHAAWALGNLIGAATHVVPERSSGINTTDVGPERRSGINKTHVGPERSSGMRRDGIAAAIAALERLVGRERDPWVREEAHLALDAIGRAWPPQAAETRRTSPAPKRPRARSRASAQD